MTSEDPDLLEVLTMVVDPCVKQLLRPGEIEHIALGYREEKSYVMPDMPSPQGLTTLTRAASELVQRRLERRLVLSMTMKGEDFVYVFSPIYRNDPYPQTDLENQRDDLFDSLQEFIVQSKFGWGQFRE